jgi:hypothetical protein
MKANFSLLFFTLIIAFSNSSSAQVHKLTYREAYNFNVGDEIYYTYTTKTSDLFYHDTKTEITSTKKLVVGKKFNAPLDTLFLFFKSAYYSTIKGPFEASTRFDPLSYDSMIITNLDDTIIKLNGKDSILDNISIGSHFVDSILCNKKVSLLNNFHFEGGYDSICIEGLGCYKNTYFAGGAYINSIIKIDGYFKGVDSCGSRGKLIESALNFYNNCITARDFFDIEIGDVYVFKRTIDEHQTELVYRKILSTNLFNNNNNLTYTFEEKKFDNKTNQLCANCVSGELFTHTIHNLNNCYYSEDSRKFNFDVANNYSEIKLELLCNIPTYNLMFQGDSYFGFSEQHQYIKGLGYLNNNKFGSYSINNSKKYFDTTETLLYIKNKFYNCGELPAIFSTSAKNETSNYVNIMPNPSAFGSDIIGYKTSSANINSFAFMNELGQLMPSVQKPNCTQSEITFIIPHSYFHIGLNIMSISFDDGHKEIHKIIVY